MPSAGKGPGPAETVEDLAGRDAAAGASVRTPVPAAAHAASGAAARPRSTFLLSRESGSAFRFEVVIVLSSVAPQSLMPCWVRDGNMRSHGVAALGVG